MFATEKFTVAEKWTSKGHSRSSVMSLFD